MPDKKYTELQQLNKALSHLTESKCSVVDTKGESPDFIVKIDQKDVGVEVIRVFRELENGNAAKIQSDLPKIAEDAVIFYNKSCNQPLVFSFGFRGTESISTNRKKISNELGEFLVEWKNQNNAYIEKNVEIEIAPASTDIKKIISHIFVQPSTATESASITMSMFNSNQIETSVLVKALRKKEKLISVYKKKCSEIWLLLVLPRMILAADYELEVAGIKIPHQFDKAYVLDEYRDKLTEIINS